MSVLSTCLMLLAFQGKMFGACSELEFAPPVTFPAGLQTHRLVTGDLNGDGNTDLAASNEGSSTITVRFGDGLGGFTSAMQFASPSPTSIAITDLNNDGIPDLAISNRTISSVSIRLGLGGGAFRPSIQVAVGPSPSGIAVADLNRDGNLDLVTSNGGNNTISILIGSGLGSFAMVNSMTVPGASGLAGIVAADFNGDGDRDIATLNRGTLNVSVMFGTGNGTFTFAGSHPAGGNQPNGITAGDLNGDGIPDLAIVNAATNNAVVRFNDGSGAFRTAVTMTTGIEPFAVATGDLDNDGYTDIITTNRRSRSLSAFRGNGRGSFGTRKDFPLDAGPRALAIGDFNNNGTIDLATGLESGSVAVLLNTCSPNSAPTIASVAVTRQQDSAPSVSAIATVSDDLDDATDLTVTVNGETASTVNGVTVRNISVSAAGVVSADVSASCGASGAMFLLAVTDSGGLSGNAMLGVGVTSETIIPSINNGKPLPNVTVYLPEHTSGVSMPVDYGLPAATDNCTLSPTVTSVPASGSQFSVGSTVVTVTATDEAGNTALATFRVNVMFHFAGLLSPLEQFPVINTASAGSAIPIKFNLGGDRGMNILAAGYPASSHVACDAMVPGPIIEETVSNGGGLQYDAASGQYKYVWKTMRSWRHSCRILILKLSDGSEHYARFSFR